MSPKIAKFSRNGNIIGEYNLNDLESLIQQGIIMPSDYYWTDEMTQWELVQSLVTKYKNSKLKKIVLWVGASVLIILITIFLVSAVNKAQEAKQREIAAKLEMQKQAALVAAQEAKQARIKADDRIIQEYESAKNTAWRMSWGSWMNKFQQKSQKYSKVSKFYPMILFSKENWGIQIDDKKLSTNGGSCHPGSLAIIVTVDELGQLELCSAYRGEGKWIFHEAVESRNSEGYFRTPTAKFSDIIREQTEFSLVEQVGYDFEASDQFLRQLIKSKDANPVINFLDKNGRTVGTLYMGTEYIEAIRDTVKLADAYKAVENLLPPASGALRRRAEDGDAKSAYLFSFIVSDKNESLMWLKASSDKQYPDGMDSYANKIKDDNPKLAEELKAKAAELRKKDTSKAMH
jgi:hypothetical protein